MSVQRGRLKSSGIEKYLQGVFISEEIGYNKPSIEYFEKCFSKIPDFKKKNTAIIGDSLSSDIQGGINAGIKDNLVSQSTRSDRRSTIKTRL